MKTAAGDEDIKRWSHGRVRAPDLFAGDGAPIQGGLECPRIFGPVRDLECACGRYRGARFRWQVCVDCGVEVIESSARRHRLGHIALPRPIRGPHGGAPLTVLPVLGPGLRPSAPDRVHPLTRSYQRLFTPLDDAALADHLAALVEAILSLQLDAVARDLGIWSTHGTPPVAPRKVARSFDRARLLIPPDDADELG